jgi:DNA/RNA endonuclease YhcR with UshA esterase domain
MCRPLQLLLCLLALSTGTVISANGPLIDSAQALNYLNQDVVVSGLVTNIFVSKRGNAFINFGDKYPNQTFTGWIPAGTPLASDASLQLFHGKNVKIFGRVELYRGKPEIRITSKDQITLE